MGRRPNPVPTHKVCASCKDDKPVTEFYQSSKPKYPSQTYSAGCRECHKEHLRRFSKTRRSKVMQRARIYNTSPEHIELLLAITHCACCGDRLPDLAKHRHIDHDHATGIIRGVLCAWCNAMIGHAKEDIGRLARGIEYLNRHRS